VESPSASHAEQAVEAQPALPILQRVRHGARRVAASHVALSVALVTLLLSLVCLRSWVFV
jgi:hypothetical protein